MSRVPASGAAAVSTSPSTADWAARYIRKYRLALVPIPEGFKGPMYEGWSLPGGYVMDAEEAHRRWSTDETSGIGAVLAPSGLCSLDSDTPEDAEPVLSALGIDLRALRKVTPTIQGNPSRYRLMFRPPPGVVLGVKKLVWPARLPGEKPPTLFELRAGNVQDLLPPTVHPGTGKPYIWLTPPNSEFPLLPEALLELWQHWDSYRKELEAMCPWAKHGFNPEPAPRGAGARPNVIAAFNQARPVEELLTEHGYKCRGKRWISPTSSTGLAGVTILEGRVYSHHASDPLADGHTHDAFDLFRILDHNGDVRSAVKAAAEELGVEPQNFGGNSGTSHQDKHGEAADTTGSSTRTEPGLTDLGNAHRFARDHRENVRYCWPWGRWLVWNDRFWSRDETGEIHRRAEATVRGMYEEAARSSQERREALATWAVKCESHERRTKMLASAQAIAGIPIQPEDMDRDPWLLNVGNGTIDLRTGTLRPQAREDFITRGIDIDYDPDAMCPTWERFIREVFADNAETIAFVQRAIGYSLTGKIIEHVLIVLYGLGSNGKTTLNDALHYLLGPYAKHAPTDLLLARRGEHHPTELATLHGARLVTAAETGEGRRLAESLVKQLTGGDPVTARRMREDFWQYRPEFKLWLATNHKPQIRGTDHAIWRRIRLIPFDVTFHAPEIGNIPRQDPTLPARLREESPGILAWAVRGCLDWQREGLKTPQAIRDATEGYRAEMDVPATFLEECCVFDKRAEASATELYRAYVRWCDDSGEHAETQTSFGSRLRERGLTSRKVHGRMVWSGIRLRAGDSGDSGDQNLSSSHEKNSQPVHAGKWSQPSPPSPVCPSCAGDGCDECAGYGRLIDDEPDEPGP